MKKNRLLTILATVAMIAFAVMAVIPFTAMAADKTYTATTLFSDSMAVDTTGSNLKLNLKKEKEVTFGKKVQTEAFAMTFNGVTSIKNLKVTFKQVDAYGEELLNAVTLNFEAGKIVYGDNQEAAVTFGTEVTVALNGNAGTVNGVAFALEKAAKNEATLALEADVAGSMTMVSLNGQSFAVAQDKLTDNAAPFVVSNDVNLKFYDSEDAAKAGVAKRVLVGVRYKPDFTVYDVLTSTNTTEFAFKDATDAEAEYEVQSSATYLSGSAGQKYLLRVKGTDESARETVRYAVVELVADLAAPSYVDEVANASAYASYRDQVVKAAIKENEDPADETVHYINIGSGQYYNIPSLETLIQCDTAYEDLSFTVYYSTPDTAERTTSKLTIEVTKPGVYTFRVVPKDTKGRHPLKENCPEFVFEVQNTEVPVVTASTSQNAGYKGVSFTCSSFTIKGYNTTAKYTLEYAESEDAATAGEWADAEEELKTLTFTPEKLGVYRVKCVVTGENGLQAAPVYSKNIVVTDPVVVKDTNSWAKDNALSIVFLSIAGVSLLGIVTLLFVKPKDKAEK